MSRSAQSFFRGASVPAVAAFVAAALVGTAQAATLTVGPVEQVNLKSSTLVVLGQTYQIGPSVSLRNQAGATETLGALTPDTLVVIDGTETTAGKTTVSSVTTLSQLDVPGATRLLVTGVVSQVTPIGEITVGKLTVDINPTLTSDSQNAAVGELVAITGTQPNEDGLFLAQSVAPVNGAGLSASGIRGGGLATYGIRGGGAAAAGIRGGGAAVSLKEGIRGGGLATYGIRGGGATAAGIRGGGAAVSLKEGIRGGG